MDTPVPTPYSLRVGGVSFNGSLFDHFLCHFTAKFHDGASLKWFA